MPSVHLDTTPDEAYHLSMSMSPPICAGAPLDQQQQMTYYQMAKAGYQELVHAIIRPPRAEYDLQELGPERFQFQGKAFRRTDFELMNPRGQALKCSHWEPDGWRAIEVSIVTHGEKGTCVMHVRPAVRSFDSECRTLTFTCAWQDRSCISKVLVQLFPALPAAHVSVDRHHLYRVNRDVAPHARSAVAHTLSNHCSHHFFIASAVVI